ncbi:MAG: methionine biosynthesis protein MetW [bacterium]
MEGNAKGVDEGLRSLRFDHREIFDIVENGSSVLDLGCGSGELLAALIRYKNVRGSGVEILEENVLRCIEKGLSVFQGDIDEGLKDYEDGSFDYVVLNQTLQVVHKPIFVLHEMLRVGRRGIVGFPNFGYWQIRAKLLLTGRMPKTEFLPYEWYDTPNIHLFTIKDFRALCWENGFRILREIAIHSLMEERERRRHLLANLLAQYGLFEIEGRSSGARR